MSERRAAGRRLQRNARLSLLSREARLGVRFRFRCYWTRAQVSAKENLSQRWVESYFAFFPCAFAPLRENVIRKRNFHAKRQGSQRGKLDLLLRGAVEI